MIGARMDVMMDIMSDVMTGVVMIIIKDTMAGVINGYSVTP